MVLANQILPPGHSRSPPLPPMAEKEGGIRRGFLFPPLFFFMLFGFQGGGWFLTYLLIFFPNENYADLPPCIFYRHHLPVVWYSLLYFVVHMLDVGIRLYHIYHLQSLYINLIFICNNVSILKKIKYVCIYVYINTFRVEIEFIGMNIYIKRYLFRMIKNCTIF